MKTMLIKTLNLFLLLTSAISFAYVEQVWAVSGTGEDRQFVHQASDFQRHTERCNENCQTHCNEKDSQDTSALTGFAQLTLDAVKHSSSVADEPAEFAHARHQHPQTRAPPVTS